MTRINCIAVEELHNKHLLAEYRELPRIFKLARAHPNIPPIYTLGKGHVIFFYDKLEYLYERQQQLYQEMRRRNYKPNFDPITLLRYKTERAALWNNWHPDEAAIKLNRDRIAERLSQMAEKAQLKKPSSTV